MHDAGANCSSLEVLSADAQTGSESFHALATRGAAADRAIGEIANRAIRETKRCNQVAIAGSAEDSATWLRTGTK